MQIKVNTKKIMKPLIKYTGGKYKEYKDFREYMPDKINNYYEPFLGGGGVMFRLLEECKIKNNIYASDTSEDLIEFYNYVTTSGFEEEITKILYAWEDIHKISDKFCENYSKLFFEIIQSDRPIEDFINDETKKFLKQELNNSTAINNIDYHGFSLYDRIYDSLYDKVKKFIKKNINREDKEVSCKSLQTAVHQGFYFTIRDMYNDWLTNDKSKYMPYERTAQWFYIREFCFGGMFRFGRDGKFNIPYGGAVYNNKNFKTKVKTATSEQTKDIFKKIKFFTSDFESVLNTNFEKDDFIFLDPPYDSTFSEYDNNSFTREDHKRLRDILKQVNCKWLMVIGKTEFIDELYKDFNKIEYDKTYMYQARGDYENKHTIHLIIKNFGNYIVFDPAY